MRKKYVSCCCISLFHIWEKGSRIGFLLGGDEDGLLWVTASCWSLGMDRVRVEDGRRYVFGYFAFCRSWEVCYGKRVGYVVSEANNDPG